MRHLIGQRLKSSPLLLARSSLSAVLFPTSVFSFVINLLLFVSPLYMMQVYDRVLQSRSGTTLVALTVITVFLLAVYAGFEFVRSRILVRAGIRFDEMIGKPLFDAVADHELVRPRTGAAQFLRDSDIVREFITGTGIIAFCDAPWMPLFIALCWMLHPLLGLTATIGAVSIFGLALINEQVTRSLAGEAAKVANESMNEASGALRNAEAVRALGMREAMRSRWSGGREAMIAKQAQASDRAGMVIAASKFIRTMLQTAVLGVGAWLAINQKISPGSMMAASILMGRALSPVEMAVGNWKAFLAARASYARLTALFEAAPVALTRPALPEPKGHLTVDGITVIPPGATKPTLRNVTFEVGPGDVVAVGGPSAAGKSTLIRSLVGLWPPAGGSLRMDGYTLDQWDSDVLGRHLGYVPQEVDLFSGTVAENIARLGETDMDKVIEAAISAGLHEGIQRLPEGYGTKVGPGGTPLSGGQRQRIALARALYGRPPLIVMDEPNSNLDAAGEEALVSAVLEAKARGAGVVFTTHKPSILRIADRILVLADGAVQTYGPRDQFMASQVGRKPGPMTVVPAAVHGDSPERMAS